jgi:hypothetical protein
VVASALAAHGLAGCLAVPGASGGKAVDAGAAPADAAVADPVRCDRSTELEDDFDDLDTSTWTLGGVGAMVQAMGGKLVLTSNAGGFAVASTSDVFAADKLAVDLEISALDNSDLQLRVIQDTTSVHLDVRVLPDVVELHRVVAGEDVLESFALAGVSRLRVQLDAAAGDAVFGGADDVETLLFHDDASLFGADAVVLLDLRGQQIDTANVGSAMIEGIGAGHCP